MLQLKCKLKICHVLRNNPCGGQIVFCLLHSSIERYPHIAANKHRRPDLIYSNFNLWFICVVNTQRYITSTKTDFTTNIVVLALTNGRIKLALVLVYKLIFHDVERLHFFPCAHKVCYACNQCHSTHMVSNFWSIYNTWVDCKRFCNSWSNGHLRGSTCPTVGLWRVRDRHRIVFRQFAYFETSCKRHLFL